MHKDPLWMSTKAQLALSHLRYRRESYGLEFALKNLFFLKRFQQGYHSKEQWILDRRNCL